MGKKSEPEITTSLLGANWTMITFRPDLTKFHKTHLDDDVMALMMCLQLQLKQFFVFQVSFVNKFATTEGSDATPTKQFPSMQSDYLQHPKVAQKGTTCFRE